MLIDYDWIFSMKIEKKNETLVHSKKKSKDDFFFAEQEKHKLDFNLNGI